MEKPVANLSKLTKVNDSFTVYRYDNGWMVEVGGRNKSEDYKTTKIICNTENELLELIKQYNTFELDS